MPHPEATLVKGSGPNVYVIEVGQRHRIPDPTTFVGRGYRWDDVITLSDRELKAIPLGAPLPPLLVPCAEKRDSLGNEHFMATGALLLPDVGQLVAVTQAWTWNFWAGFTGGVLALLVDEAGAAIGETSMQTFYVAGLAAAGPSARTDYWRVGISPTLAAQTRAMAIVHKTAPEDRCEEILKRVEQAARAAVDSRRLASDLIIELAAIVA
jgi:hypothetical protein